MDAFKSELRKLLHLVRRSKVVYSEMAEAAVSLLLSRFCDLLVEESLLFFGAGDQVESIEAELRRMQCFLKDADAKRAGDERVRNWVSEVRDASYDAEDIIDTFVLQVASRRRNGCGFSLAGVLARRAVSKEIEQIKIKIHGISESRPAYGIENIGGEGPRESLLESRRWHSSPHFDDQDLVGFEEDTKMLVEQLVGRELRRCVVSVVGMGGLGKTALAKKVYNSSDIKRHFDCCAWVYVSQECRPREHFQAIAKCFMELGKEEIEAVEKMDVVELGKKISEYVKERRYLVVFDDIWIMEAWDDLGYVFPDTHNGSRLMLTTRNKDVALYADARRLPYELQLLKEEDSWELFCRKAFLKNGSVGFPPDLEEIGRKIVAKCQGLPLAIIVLGGLISRKEETANDWGKVLMDIGWQLNKGLQLPRILALSYDDLPFYLKSCFLYFGVFPEDYEIRASRLFRLWMAEGFIHERQGMRMEEVAENYLDELVSRSLIQVGKRSTRGGIKTCRIHDLIRDLSISKAREDKFLNVHQGNAVPSSPSGARRLAVHHSISRYVYPIPSSQRLRSMLCFTLDEESLGRKQQRILYGGFKLLRVIDFYGLRISTLPGEIGELIHLRYLRLNKTCLQRLPSSIGNLHELQTLDIRSFQHVSVPYEIRKMQHLRHLYVASQESQQSKQLLGAFTMYAGLSKIVRNPRFDRLTNLQTLSMVMAGHWIEGGLGKLTNLRKLGICGDFRVHEKGLFNSLAKLDQLQSLLLVAVSGSIIRISMLPHHLNLRKLRLYGLLEKLLKPHDFPTSLTKVSLIRSELEQNILAMLENLPNLLSLKLLESSYTGKEIICSAGGFPQLQILELRDLNELETWKVEEGAMHKLRSLYICNCRHLEMLPKGLFHVTTLQELQLLRMSEGFKAKLQEIDGEDWYKIRHIPSITVT